MSNEPTAAIVLVAAVLAFSVGFVIGYDVGSNAVSEVVCTNYGYATGTFVDGVITCGGVDVMAIPTVEVIR